MTRLRIDPERSVVIINARSSVHPIHTRAQGLEGHLDVDVSDGVITPGSEPEGQLSFPVERMRSGNPLEDRELRRRIDAKRHPTIDGTLVELEHLDGDRFRVVGDVTFRGVTNRYEHDMTFTRVDDHTIALAGEATFDVREFGMEPPRILMLKVEPQVNVRVELIAVF
jgi:polyisoprenoid-binding protein YceI